MTTAAAPWTPFAHLRRTAGDPRVLSAGILSLLVLAIALRHPLGTALGTAGPAVPAVIPVAAVAPAQTSLPADLARRITAVPVVALHPPRDPFIPRDRPQTASAVSAAAVTVAVPVSPRSSTSYLVRRGDSLWSISRSRLGPLATTAQIANAWRRVYENNRAVIGADPSLLRVGVVLQSPA